MIGRLRGLLLEKKPPQLLVEVHGVGYQLLVPLSVFMQLPDLNQEVILYTEMIVREDAHLLYGFIRESDRTLFQTVIKVNGVGPKLALAVLSSMDPDTFIQAIQESNLGALTKLPGVGKKTAERLVIELRDKLSSSHSQGARSNFAQTVLMTAGPKEEAISALESLGFKAKEAEKAVQRVYDSTKTSEELIRLALQGS